MSDILSEEKADKEVINSLMRHIHKLEERLKMSIILRDNDGNLYRATAYELVTADQLADEAAELESKAKELRDYLSAPAPEAQPEAEVEQPAQPEVTAPTVDVAVAEAQQAAPEEPQQPVDPATAPAPAPIVLS